MALTLRKQPADSVSNPTSASRVSLFVDSVTGNPSTKDSTGAVAPMVTVDGSPLTLNEVTVPGTEANKGKLYAKDVAGGTELFYLDDSGTEVQMTDAGATAGGGGGAGTYFQDALISDDIVVNVPSGGGSIVYPTGLTLPALAANQNMGIRIETRLVSADGSDAGWWTPLHHWGAAPALPIANLTPLGYASGQAGSIDALQTVMVALSVDAGGAVSIEIDDSKSSTLFGSLRMAITIDQLDYDPTV